MISDRRGSPETAGTSLSGPGVPAGTYRPISDPRPAPDRTRRELPIRSRKYSTRSPLVDGPSGDAEPVGDLGDPDDVDAALRWSGALGSDPHAVRVSGQGPRSNGPAGYDADSWD